MCRDMTPELAKLIRIADAYKAATGIEKDSTVSSRVFDDGKKLGALRAGATDLTTGRYNAALRWFSENWPEWADVPYELFSTVYTVEKPREALMQ